MSLYTCSGLPPYLPVCLFTYLSIFLAVDQSTCPSINLFISLPVGPSTCTCTPFCLSIRPPCYWPRPGWLCSCSGQQLWHCPVHPDRPAWGLQRLTLSHWPQTAVAGHWPSVTSVNKMITSVNKTICHCVNKTVHYQCQQYYMSPLSTR